MRLSKPLVWAVLVGYLFRAFIPLGWMPATDATAHAGAIVICTASGLSTIFIDETGKPVEDGPGGGEDHGAKLCPFGAVPKFSVLNTSFALNMPAQGAVREIKPYLIEAAFDLKRFESYAPRDPPIFI